jgi:hypothetical protein
VGPSLTDLKMPQSQIERFFDPVRSWNCLQTKFTVPRLLYAFTGDEVLYETFLPCCEVLIINELGTLQLTNLWVCTISSIYDRRCLRGEKPVEPILQVDEHNQELR